MNKHAQRLRALAKNSRDGSWYRIRALQDDEAAAPDAEATVTGTVAVIDLYDEIGGWFGVDAGEFIREVRALDVQEIQLHISSPGGDVFDAIAITNALRQHPARVVATVDGIAASAASFIAAAADETVMAQNSELFVHDAWGFAMGNAEDMATMASDLNRVSDNIASIYAAKAGSDAESWRVVMRAETWYSAEEAVAAGLADRVLPAPSKTEKAEAANRFDLSVFNRATRAAPAPRTPAASASGPRTTRTPRGGSAVAFSNEQLTTMRQRLGVASDADEGIILAALEEVLAEQATPQTSSTTVPEGMALVDAVTLEQLRTQAAAGAEARRLQQGEARERLVNAAVTDGRIAPARREAWLHALAADAGAADTLAALSPGLVPLSELGHGDTDHLTDADSAYVALFGKD